MAGKKPTRGGILANLDYLNQSVPSLAGLPVGAGSLQKMGAPNARRDGSNDDMSDKDALIKEKNDLIAQMLEMQKQFIDLEHDKGISGKDYYYSQDGLLADYRQKYRDMAMRVVDLSHQIVGSSRF